jgi:hypothetical protein
MKINKLTFTIDDPKVDQEFKMFMHRRVVRYIPFSIVCSASLFVSIMFYSQKDLDFFTP